MRAGPRQGSVASELARDLGISPSTARQWVGVRQGSNQIPLPKPYHRSLGKRLAKIPKLYFTDTGLAAFLMGLQSPAALRESPFADALWEDHVVVIELPQKAREALAIGA